MTRKTLEKMLFKYYGLTGSNIAIGVNEIHNAYSKHLAKVYIEKNKLESELKAKDERIDELINKCLSLIDERNKLEIKIPQLQNYIAELEAKQEAIKEFCIKQIDLIDTQKWLENPKAKSVSIKIF